MTQFVTVDRTEPCFLLSFNTTSRLSCTPYEWVMVLLWPPGGIFLGIYPWWVISLTCHSLCEWLLGARRPSVDCGFSSTFSLPDSRGVTKSGDQYGVSPGRKYALGVKGGLSSWHHTHFSKTSSSWLKDTPWCSQSQAQQCVGEPTSLRALRMLFTSFSPLWFVRVLALHTCKALSPEIHSGFNYIGTFCSYSFFVFLRWCWSLFF